RFCEHQGPARTREKSSTRTPASAWAVPVGWEFELLLPWAVEVSMESLGVSCASTRSNETSDDALDVGFGEIFTHEKQRAATPFCYFIGKAVTQIERRKMGTFSPTCVNLGDP